MNIVFGQLVGDFAGYFVPNTTVTKAAFQSSVNRNALYIAYLFVGKFVLSYISMLTVRISGLRTSAALRLAYLRALFAQPVSTIDTISAGKVSARITTSSNTIQLAISQQFAMLIQAIALTGGFYVVAFIYDWLLTLVASASLPLILLAYGSTLPFYIEIHKKTEHAQEQASALAFEIFGSIRVVVAFGAEERLSTQHNNWLLRAKRTEMKNGPLVGLMMFPSFFSMYGTFGLTFWFGIRQYMRGDTDDLTAIVIVLFSVVMAVMSVGRVASPIIAIAKAATAATELFKTIDSETPDTSGLKAPEISVHADVVLKDVSFIYPSRPDVQVLDGLNVKFEAGKVTAIVGPSGSGKSTIVGLLERWYDLPDKSSKISGGTEEKTLVQEDTQPAEDPNTRESGSGSIRIGHIDLRNADLKWWRSQIGLVQQEPFLFNDTIYNNVAYGLCSTQWHDAPKEETLALVKDACKESYADEFISKLPLGYDTVVGESGIKLSGGQRQRIAIARSIIKQPPILILDEATSAVDVRTERIVQKALDRVSENRTTIVIAHRLSTIKRADKIVVLRKGRVVEEGSHQQLINKQDGVYYGLVHAQELLMGTDGLDDEILLHPTRVESATVHQEAADTSPYGTSLAAQSETNYKQKDILRSFGRLMYEQRSHWILYSLTVVGAIGAGVVYPLQAYLFAKIIDVFTLTGSELVNRGNFWAGMFGVLAVGVGVSYFVLGWSSYTISVAVSTHYRQEYIDNILRKRIAFFDTEGNSAGTLTSRLSTDSTQLQQLMGTEMSMALISAVNLLGSLAISFAFGWKLSLVGLFSILPIILSAGYFRVKLEMQFEAMNAAVFADSSQYGGRLLAAREYDLVQFFIVYMAVVQGSQAAGMWFSFAPNVAEATGAANRILSLRPSGTKEEYPPEALKFYDGSVGIEFLNVYFTYESRDVPVITGLSLKVEPGQFAALVGASGTIRENVALSVDAASATDQAIQQACIEAQIHNFIVSLPEGKSPGT
ncbi:hypothetical protein H2199_007896 [Coniosporium tulheliwenetii]|uniref:Uncharacterized protein n=1 Tax=Coniosporium tulheliwenetii TaxID=3383036 RepID=A0ACC2YLK6_9PEZI|nr:hypothetical protein H2199_007896 [Cladosporium sp. JES 115]